MRPLRNIFMVRARLEDEGSIKIAGTTIEIAEGFNPYRYAVQVGEIAAVPMKVDQDFIYNIPLEVGNKIHFHHFCVSEENAQVVNGEVLYAIKYRDIYCREELDGSITPMQDYVFLSPVLEDESNCKSKSGLWIKPTQDILPLVGKVEATCKEAEEVGITAGSVVRFLKNSDYDITVNGKKYYRMKAKRIIALMDVSPSETVS